MEKWNSPKEYLSQLKDLDNLIDTKLESIKELRCRLFDPDYKIDVTSRLEEVVG